MEQINEMLLGMINMKSDDMMESYFSNVNQMSELLNVSKETPALGDVAAMCAVWGITLNIVKNLICELFGIEDTSAAGKKDRQAEQQETT